MHSARVFLHAFTAHRDVGFDLARLVFGHGARWAHARWIFSGGTADLTLPSAEVVEIAAASGPFPLVIEELGWPNRPLEVTGVLAGEPHGAHCLLYAPRGDGFWRGHTLATHQGRLVLRPYDYDPA